MGKKEGGREEKREGGARTVSATTTHDSGGATDSRQFPTIAHLITARTAGGFCLFAAHTDAINHWLITTEYDEHQKQSKDPWNRLQTLEIALELKETEKTWHPGKKSETDYFLHLMTD